MTNLESKIYNQEGKEVGNIDLAPEVFDLKWNADAVHQVVESMRSSARRSTAHTKTRGEVRGGGRKPWRQKGTGRARHGSIRSPIWVGGGVAHGPRSDKNYERKVNRKMKAKVLGMILSKKFKDREIFFLDSLSVNPPKTKEAKEKIVAWTKVPDFGKVAERRRNAFVIGLPTRSVEIARSFRNFGNISVEETRNLNPILLLKYRGLLLVDPKKTLPDLYKKFNAESKVKEVSSKPERKTKAVKK